MKRIINIIFSIFLLILFVVPKYNLSAIDNFIVYELKSDGTKTIIGEATTDYNAAYTLMNEYDANPTSVAIIEKNGIVVNSNYAIAKLKGLFNVYSKPNRINDNYYTYLAGDYGVDAAFLDYDNTYNSVKIRISGYTGWISLDNLNIVPISKIATNYVTINKENLYLRKSYSTSSELYNVEKPFAQYNASYIWVEKVENEGYIWYHLKEGSTDAWVASKDDYVTEDVRPYLDTNYLRFNNDTTTDPWNLYHNYVYKDKFNIEKVWYTNLGIAPSFLVKNKYYYSFDGIYFYEKYIDMIDDYRKNTHDLSINKDEPYYNYYLYLPAHSFSSYNGKNLDNRVSVKINPSNPELVKKPIESASYVTDGSFNKSIENLSQMYGEGDNFILSQEEYGINALLTFGAAMNESGDGTSAIAFAKNNLFGHGAYDSCAFTCAITYNTVKDSIFAHALNYATSYSNPTARYYYGSHYGNKGSGFGVNYASDPYWGEKAAQYAYESDINIAKITYTLDGETFEAGQDYLKNTIGIKTSNIDVPIKKEANNDSKTIYLLKNNYNNRSVFNMPLIVFDKVSIGDEVWYKVYADTALDSNKNIINGKYDRNYSFGYVSSKYLYVSNNQPIIKTSEIILEQGKSYDLTKFASATDTEDGDITSKIVIDHNIKIDTVGSYKVTYKVFDSMNMSATKEVEAIVYATNTPYLTASNKEVMQYKDFDKLNGVSAIDPNDGDITDKIKIIYDDVDINKVGTYKITYSITNAINKTVTKDINVIVTSNASPVLKATDIYMNKGDSLTYKENIKASDLEDGNITNNIKITSNVDKDVPGTYKITYSIIDSDDNEVTKDINVYVSDILEEKKGEFYFNTLAYNKDTNKLDVTGSISIVGIDNTKDINIDYYLIFQNNNNDNQITFKLDRYLNDHPTIAYMDINNKYVDTWYKGSIDLTNIIKGDYTLYVMAKSDQYVSKCVVSNLFLKKFTKKIIDNEGRGYLFRNNNYKREFPLEMIISDNGLITSYEGAHPSNMFNLFDSISFKDNYLNMIGNSFNMGTTYGEKDTIERYLIFENMETEERITYNIGSTIGSELILNGNDNLSKVRSWYDTTNLVDIKDIKVGKYIIYIRTKNGSVDDYGELQDILLKSNHSTVINNKIYTLSTNNKIRYRVELEVKEKN